VSISFLVDLSGYTLYRPIGKGKRPLLRRMDVLDVAAILMDLGYKVIVPRFGYAGMWGVDMHDLRGDLTKMSLGIPTIARVNIKTVGRATDKVVVTLRY
jgi:hypothetical protein